MTKPRGLRPGVTKAAGAVPGSPSPSPLRGCGESLLSVAASRMRRKPPLRRRFADAATERGKRQRADVRNVGEIRAAEVRCPPFDKSAFRSALREARGLTAIEDPEIWLPRLTSLCNATGVVVCLVPPIGKARVSGAARWLAPEKALIQLSLRGRWAEAFWFTFFHEAAHILLHSKKRTFIDDDQGSDELEAEADRFALDFLIPQEYLPKLPTLRTAADVRRFAAEIGVGTGIVAGRLHKENLIPKNWFNKADIHPRYSFG